MQTAVVPGVVAVVLACASCADLTWADPPLKLLRQFDFRYSGPLPEVPMLPAVDGPYVQEMYDEGESQGGIGSTRQPSMSGPYGNLLLVAGQRRVIVYDYRRGTEVLSFDAPHSIGGAALSPDGKLAAIVQCEKHPGSRVERDCYVAVYDLATKARVRTLASEGLSAADAYDIRCRFTPGADHVLVFNAQYGDVSLWDVRTGKLVWHDIPGGGSGVDARGRYFFYQRCWIENDGSPMASLTGLPDRKAHLKWGEPPVPFDHELGLDISADGSRIVYGAGVVRARDTDPPTRFRDGFVGVFDTKANKVLFCTDQLASRHYGSVPAVAITSDGKRIVACTKTGMVLLDGDSGGELYRWRPEPLVDPKSLPDRADYLTPYVATALSADEKEVIVCDFWGRITVWKLPASG